jgi:hypothetical protein
LTGAPAGVDRPRDPAYDDEPPRTWRSGAVHDPAKSVRIICDDLGVEVAGIEPASCDASPGLLRAQSAVSLLDPIDLTDESM